MTITPKPKKHQNDIDLSSNEDSALKFIESAGQPVAQPTTPPAKVATDPKPIIVRGIDVELMERLDREAARRRVSRAAMVRMLLVEHLPE